MSIGKRIKRAYNAFINNDKSLNSESTRYYRNNLFYTVNESFVTPVYSRIAVDLSTLYRFTHAWVDYNHIYSENVDSRLNELLQNYPNTDQDYISFFNDLVYNLLVVGEIAVVAVDKVYTSNEIFDITNLRLAKIIEDSPRYVRVSIYNEDPMVDNIVEITLPKKEVAIIKNPHFHVMNATNTTLQRLAAKLTMLDESDYLNNGKLDLVIQTPFAVKSDRLAKRAQERVTSLQQQLKNNDLGVGYIDSTEKLVQLNRSYGGNLLAEVDDLTARLYNQLGISGNFMTGEISDVEIGNYLNRTVNPIVMSICSAFTAAFVPEKYKKNASRSQRILSFRNPFQFSDTMTIISAADALTRNEIVASNEFRAIIGLRPVASAAANELRNRNIRPDFYTPGETPTVGEIPASDEGIKLSPADDSGIQEGASNAEQ